LSLKPGLSVLHCDDSNTLRKIVKGMLIQIGVDSDNIDGAEDGKAGLDKIEADNHYDLLLLDWTMPRMSGLELLKVVRTHENKKIASLPVIMVSAEGMSDNIRQAGLAGANAYVTKPFSPEKLLKNIEKITA